LCIRMTQVLQSYDADLESELRDTAEEFIEPMPFIMI
jgi:hypothetical protein